MKQLKLFSRLSFRLEQMKQLSVSVNSNKIEIIEEGNLTGANVHMWGGPEILISAVGGSKGTRSQIVRA